MTKLADLNPRWIHPNVLMFDCPCGCKGTQRETLLTCKNVEMSDQDQIAILETVLGDEWNRACLSKCATAWTFSGQDFSTLSVHPSIDASASGHWHGVIDCGGLR